MVRPHVRSVEQMLSYTLRTVEVAGRGDGRVWGGEVVTESMITGDV